MKYTKQFNKNLIATTLAVFLALGPIGPASAFAAGPAPVDLLSADNFSILGETAITTTGATTIVGNVGISPNSASSITGLGLVLDGSGTFSTSAMVDGKIYAADYTDPTPAMMTTAVNDMLTAYNDAAGRTIPTATELGAGDISGMTITPGLYKWSTGVTIPTNVTLSGGPDDVWIFQIAGDLSIASAGDLASGIKVLLTGGAQAANIFWQVGGPTGATLGTYSTFNGNILSAKQIIVETGAVLNGRALAQTQVTLDSNAVSVANACAAVTQTIVSDATETIATGDGPAISVTPHAGWTATISSSTSWIWETGPTSPDETVAFERLFTASGTILSAQLDIAADNSYKVFIDGVEVAADAAENNFQLATQDTYDLTADVTSSTHTLRIEVTNPGTYEASGNPAGLLYKLTIVTCPSSTPSDDVTVTIVKYIDGQHANATSGESLSFPMQSSWDATNIGAGSGSYSLGPVGSNNPNSYEATTANMSSGADYSTNEDTSGPTVGANCAEGKPFALSGYTTGKTEAAAIASTPTSTSPVFTDLLSSKYVIVWNEDCSLTSASSSPKLTLDKIVVNDDSGTQLPSAWTLTATGPTPISGPGATSSTDVESGPSFAPGTYTLSESTGPAGYTSSTWSCVKNGGSPVSGDSITLVMGDIATCTITNNDNDDEVPPPPVLANACNTPTVAPAGYTLQNGTNGNDRVTLASSTMFVGKGGNDNITTGNGNYIICTGSGNDRIITGNGNVIIGAGGGNNNVTTGDGNGTIATGSGNDRIVTGTGDHTIDAGSGNNNVTTGDGNQNVTTGNGNDRITTGSGNDTINAGGGNNNVDAGGGTDTVNAGSGNDRIDGGTGTDSCNAGGGNNNVINCP